MTRKSQKEKPPEIHSCFEQVNERLRQINCTIKLRPTYDFNTHEFGPFSFAVPLEKIDSSNRKTLPTIVATFCPFCGERIHGENKHDPGKSQGGS